MTRTTYQFHCPVCDTLMGEDEMAVMGTHGLEWITRVERQFQGPVCHDCANDLRECYVCYTIAPSATGEIVCGEWACSPECVAEMEYDAGLEETHVHSVRMQLQGGKG